LQFRWQNIIAFLYLHYLKLKLRRFCKQREFLQNICIFYEMKWKAMLNGQMSQNYFQSSCLYHNMTKSLIFEIQRSKRLEFHYFLEVFRTIDLYSVYACLCRGGDCVAIFINISNVASNYSIVIIIFKKIYLHLKLVFIYPIIIAFQNC